MISVIIPIYLIESNKDKITPLLQECVQSLKGYDELILQFDNNGEGFAKTVNKGVRRAKGEWIVIVNDDTRMLNGSIDEMCKYKRIVRPKLVGGELAKFAFVVMQKDVWEDVGDLDEDFEVGFYEDDDWIDRATDKGYIFLDSDIQVFHYGGATIQDIDGDFEEINKKLYEDKCRLRDEQKRGSKVSE